MLALARQVKGPACLPGLTSLETLGFYFYTNPIGGCKVILIVVDSYPWLLSQPTGSSRISCIAFCVLFFFSGKENGSLNDVCFQCNCKTDSHHNDISFHYLPLVYQRNQPFSQRRLHSMHL